MPMIIKIIHEDGICRVPIANYPNQFVTLYEDDLEELFELGVDMNWKFSNGTVWSQSGAKRISVARLICDAGENMSVLFVDRNPFNMLRENLVLAPGRAKYRARDRIDFSSNTLRREGNIEHDVR
jgi:hypothetical protein